MDAETEEMMLDTGVEVMEEGDELDRLLHKAVTVSQVNLPQAAIDRAIDDIATSYCEDPTITSTPGIDDDVLKLIERTRQRRELLNQKMGKTPEAAPRKRRTPLTEDLSDNIAKQDLGNQQIEDSPKRQCVRENENQVKPDTPAIPSVRSRMHDLASQRSEWSDLQDKDAKEAPVPTPRKSLSSPPLEKKQTPLQENLPSSNRKSRFAQLAQSINNWEDDLSHPTITKEEEKKPRWQPPKTVMAPSHELSSAKKGPAPPPPTTTTTASKFSSPKKTAAPPPPEPSTSSASKTPTRSTSRVEYNSSPKPFKPYDEGTTKSKITPVKSPACSKSNLAPEKEEKQEAPKPAAAPTVVEKKGGQTPLPAAKPSDRPLSARLANWEQKISESSKPDVPATPKSGVATSTHVSQTPKQLCTPARQFNTPARDVATDVVQMRPKVRKSIDDEPTAHSVSARMSAWEQISSADNVSNIKKVRPGDCTPVKTPGPKTPAAKTPGNMGMPSAQKPPLGTTPGKAADTGKSFQDSIKERAQQVNPNAKASGSSPVKGTNISPSKAGPAMKTVQQRLMEQTKSTDMAERLRQERMAELQSIKNRWKNGILREDSDVPEEEPPKPVTNTTASTRKEAVRERARADNSQEDKAEPMEVDEKDSVDKPTVHTTPVDKELTGGLKGLEKTGACNSTDQSNSPCFEVKANKTEAVKEEHERLVLEGNGEFTQQNNTEPEQIHLQPPVLSKTVQLCKSEFAQLEMSTSVQQDMTSSVQQEKLESVKKEHTESVQQNKDNVPQHKNFEPGQQETVEVDHQEQIGSGHMETLESAEQETSETAQQDKTEPVPVETHECEPEKAGSPAERKKQTEAPPVIEHSSENFENKLSAMGFDVSDEGKASCSFRDKEKAEQKKEVEKKDGPASNQPPPAPPAPCTSSAVSGKPPARPTSLYGIVSQKKAAAAQTPPKSTTSKTCRKVKFDDSFDSDDSDASLPKKQALQRAGTDKPQVAEPPKPAAVPKDDITPESDTTEVTEDDSEYEVTLRRPRPDGTRKVIIRPQACDDDDLSLSAFVPESVRRQSILPSKKGGQDLDTSTGSLDSFEGAPGAPPDIHKSTVDLVRLGQQHAYSSSSLTSQSTADSSDLQQPQRSGYSPDETEESVDERDAIGDLLDEAMDSDEDQPSVSGKPPTGVKRYSHMMATRESSLKDKDLPFSISSYRAERKSQVIEVKQTITRNSQYVGKQIVEEDVEMPTERAAPVSRQTIQERIRELQELIQQEQNVIMQTSNALNQCCSNSSYFAGSAEQVECNRLLLIACQKRQSYLTEIQRLKDTGCLDNSGPGPKGSLTISDIRLPLKKEFVTKIGTSHDNTTYYFILLIRNGPQLIVTQMLSTHDPMMRGSLDFPNLIKINGITGSFKLNLEIYCMSVSRELTGKDKKKKTPKKLKGSNLSVQSPGGPMAVHTTSFTQVTSVPLTMKSLDKQCFQLERLSYLSPLHGTIYMNLKCLMEASVEEKGFLTMFEDVSGLGSWHRRWCVLGGNKLSFWKYPDDETRKDPLGYIDLKRCVTEKVGLISRDICARPHTFELMTVRQPRQGERDTLISRTYNTMTTIRHMLSADTKEERIVWCNKLNRALANIRTWHTDAMRPVSK